MAPAALHSVGSQSVPLTGSALVEPDPGKPTLPPPAPDDGDGAPPYDMTLQGLLDAWGLQDSMYDLNADGTVDVTDLMKWLAKDGP